jgi:hypothetical protein
MSVIGMNERWAGQCESRENRLGELNTNLRSFPPGHAATADGCVVKHKIECIRNSDGTFHFEAGAPVRQIGDRTIDQRLMAFEDDARSLESAVGARHFGALASGYPLFDLPPYAPRCVSRGRRA